MISQKKLWLEWPPALLRTGSLLVVGQAGEVLQHLVDVLVGPLGPLECGVRLVDVGLVVLVVVDPHRLLVDVRLQRVVVVGKVGNFVGHLGLLHGSQYKIRLYL